MELFANLLSRNSKDIGQHYKSLQKAITSYLTEAKTDMKSQKANKEIDNARKSINALTKLIFDPKQYNEDLFEMLMSKSLIRFLTDSLQYMPLTTILFPLIAKILFESNSLLQSIGLNEEILLMNTNIIKSIKIMIKKFIDIIGVNSKEAFIEDQMLIFIHFLMDKLILYPNFYFAISSSIEEGTDGSYSFESHLFKLIVDLFAIEASYNKRESKSIIRKGLMKCLNLENFYTVKKSIIEKLLECLVGNLISYYKNFVLFDLVKWLSMNDLPKGASGEDIKTMKKEDTISYLKFFSMITHCFATKELKLFLSNIIVNYFLCDEIQKDIITLGNNCILDYRLKKVLEFLYLMTEYINNYEISEMLFYFLFGFNNYYLNEEGRDCNKNDNDDSNEDDDNSNEVNLEHIISLEDEDNKAIDKDKDKKSASKDKDKDNNNGVSASKIAENINNFLRQSSNCKGGISDNFNLNIQKTKHNFESIIAFFTLIIECNDSESKSYLMLTLTNIAKNAPYVFMTELVVPYYLNYLSNAVNNNPTQFESLCEKVKQTRDKIEILDILKFLHPKNFSINSFNWIDYFENQLTQNYKLSMNMLNRIDNATPNLNDSSINESLSRDINFLNVQMNSSMTIGDYSTMRTLQSELGLGMDETTLNIDSTMTQMITNYTVNLRIHFFESLINAFKKFPTNKYIDNLYYSQFFLEVCSLPYAVDKGEIGDHIYNIYSNITFAGKKNKVLLKGGFIGLMYGIKNKLDDRIRLNYTKEEIDRFASFRLVNDEKTNEKLNNKDKEFFDNVKLYNELFKELIMNIFSKVCIDQVNFCWGKKVMLFNNDGNGNEVKEK